VNGHITSPDGYCRAFADDAQGCVFGSGVGLVVLKPLKRAIADGDNVLAVIKATAINNDGALKLGFTAPSAQGQARVIADALELAGCEPDSIQSIEAHGTGTALGDPIEFEGLRAVFGGPRASGERCALGSIKTNIGHLGSAAGIAGLIKTIQALRHRQIPPSLHAAVPSSKIDFKNSPFFVNGELSEWPAPANGPRRGGVSSFGVGGTNAHIIVEEAPAAVTPSRTDRSQLLLISARTAGACRQAGSELGAALRGAPNLALEDVAYTLQLGRKAHEWRSALVCDDTDAAARVLCTTDLPLYELNRRKTPQVVFVLAGEGITSIEAIRSLHRQEPAFAFAFDRCAEILLGIAAYDLHRLLAVAEETGASPDRSLAPRQRMGLQFTSEYALTQLWLNLGVKPAVLLGRALGEYVAACVADVFSLETALALVDARARLLLPQEPEQHCIVDTAVEPLREIVEDSGCRIVSMDGPRRCGVSATAERIQALSRKLRTLGIEHRRAPSADLSAARAFDASGHAGYAVFAEILAQTTLHPPALALVLSGNEDQHRQPDDRRYWERQPVNVVQFHAALQKIDRIGDPIVLSIGTCAALDAAQADRRLRVSSVADGEIARDARNVFLEAVSALWVAGVEVDWNGLHAGRAPRRVSLPGYPFQRERHWIERSAFNRLGAAAALAPGHRFSDPSTPAAWPGAVASVTPTDDRSRIQTEISAIWKGVLGMTNIDNNDNFFDIGGTSLTATSIFARIKSEFGLELPLDKMFEFATIRQMSLYIAAKLDPGIVDRLSPQELEEMLAMTED
jgi:acyl transferase domain-containing protein